MTPSLSDLQKRAATLSQARDKLRALLSTMQASIDSVKAGSLPDIQRTARTIARQHTELAALIEGNPQLFTKPRSYVVDGLKFGLQKQKGRMSWDDDDALCARIDRLAADGAISAEQAELCVRTSRKPVTAGLERLDTRLIKRLGITVQADTDAPLIKSVDSEVEKAVNAVLRAATDDANAEVAA